MLRIAIVEPDPVEAKRLRECLEQYARETGARFQTDEYSGAIPFLSTFRASCHYDAVFMDVEQPNFSGLEAAAQMRRFDRQSLLVFLACTAQYAVQGYGVEAFDYLLKPLSYAAAAAHLHRLTARADGLRQGGVLLHTEGTVVRLPWRAVRYLEVVGHYITWHTEYGVYRTLESLKTVQTRLPGRYSAVSRWNLVNLRCVAAVAGGRVTLSDGTTLNLSRRRRQAFLEDLEAWTREEASAYA